MPVGQSINAPPPNIQVRKQTVDLEWGELSVAGRTQLVNAVLWTADNTKKPRSFRLLDNYKPKIFAWCQMNQGWFWGPEIARNNTYLLLNGRYERVWDFLIFCECDRTRDGGKAVLVMCDTGKLEGYRAQKKCSTCGWRANVWQFCYWCNQCDEMFCQRCGDNVIKYPHQFH